jgi:hypothetical protein
MSAEGACFTAKDYLLAEVIAERAADLLHATPPHGHLVDARRLAGEFGVDRSWIYAHADELGAIRLGDGSKPRLRFDLDAARETFTCYASKQSQGSNVNAGAESVVPAAGRRRRLPNRLPEPGSVLAVRSHGASSSGGEVP